jgi:hypothetical protein
MEALMMISILFEDFFTEIEAFSGLRGVLNKFLEASIDAFLKLCEAFTKKQKTLGLLKTFQEKWRLFQ